MTCLADSAGLGGYEASLAVQLLVSKLHILKKEEEKNVNLFESKPIASQRMNNCTTHLL